MSLAIAYAFTAPRLAATPIVSVHAVLLAAAALIGITLVFSAYVLAKHGELETLRRLEESERAERDALRVRLAEIAALFDAAILLSLHPDVGRMLKLVCTRVVAALDADLASVFLADGDGPLELRAAHGREQHVVTGAELRAGSGPLGEVALIGKPLHIAGADLATGVRGERALSDLPVVAAFPVRSGPRIAGVLVVGGGRVLAEETTLTALGLFADSLGAALARVERERRADGRNLTLERANRELVEHHRQSEIFLATATHELRTPLSGIVSYSEVLADYYDTIADDERRWLASALNHQCKALMGLVDELFDFARLQSGRLTLDAELVRVHEIVASACDVVQPAARELGITIERQLADLGPVMLDPTKIRQCVLNLLSNAIKFTEPRSTVTVRLSAAAQGIEVAVTDTGPGIPEHEVERIFEIFHSGPARRGTKSLGLGLYLVKSIIELHGGTVAVKSQPGMGSTFAFTLPWAPPAHQEAPAAA